MLASCGKWGKVTSVFAKEEAGQRGLLATPDGHDVDNQQVDLPGCPHLWILWDVGLGHSQALN